MTCHYPDLGIVCVSDWLTQISANQKRYPDLGSDASAVWNFFARFSDVISREVSGGVVKCRLFSHGSVSPCQSKSRDCVLRMVYTSKLMVEQCYSWEQGNMKNKND